MKRLMILLGMVSSCHAMELGNRSISLRQIMELGVREANIVATFAESFDDKGGIGTNVALCTVGMPGIKTADKNTLKERLISRVRKFQLYKKIKRLRHIMRSDDLTNSNWQPTLLAMLGDIASFLQDNPDANFALQINSRANFEDILRDACTINLQRHIKRGSLHILVVDPSMCRFLSEHDFTDGV